MIYLLTASGLTPGGISTVHIYTQTVHRTTQLTASLGGFLRFELRVVKLIGKSVGRAPSLRVIPWYLFALQLGKKHGNTSFRVRKILSHARKTLSQGTEKPRVRKNLSQVLYLSPCFCFFVLCQVILRDLFVCVLCIQVFIWQVALRC
jgi:hypothetical protein